MRACVCACLYACACVCVRMSVCVRVSHVCVRACDYVVLIYICACVNENLQYLYMSLSAYACVCMRACVSAYVCGVFDVCYCVCVSVC